MRVKCNVTETELETEIGKSIASKIAECSRCGHITESFGTGQASVLRCLVLMREECPNAEKNFYIED